MATKKIVDPEKIERFIKKESREYVKDIERCFSHGLYDPMITDVSFWNYKNVSNGVKLEFNFPVSLIIGPNGTNKTSILRALESFPVGKSLSDYWFGTKLDPILNESQKTEYFYSYSIPGNKNDITAQVRYRRVIKSSRKNLDHFETARPSVKLGMEKVDFSDIPASLADYHTASRWKPIDKEVVYIDMRQRVSAYDIYRSFGTEEHLVRGDELVLEDELVWRGDRLVWRDDNGERISATQKMKNRIKRTSKRMFEIFRLAGLEIAPDEMKNELNDLAMYHGVSRVENIPISLSEEEVKWVSYILGRKYKKITVLYHSFFGLPESTVKIEVENGDNATNSTKYSDAYAGSGEYAVIMMVHHIYVAKEKSLILMDEPENSLHPESQRRLMKYILYTALNKKIQFIISSHSQYMSESMPDESRIVLYLGGKGSVEVESCVGHSQAFMGIGGASEVILGKITIQTEDNLAARILRESIYRKYPRKMSQYEFKIFGGVENAYNRLIPTYIKDYRKDVFLVFDGDQNYHDVSDVSIKLKDKFQDEDSYKYISCKVALYLGRRGYVAVRGALEKNRFDEVEKVINGVIFSSGNRPQSEKLGKLKEALKWLLSHVHYLPGKPNEPSRDNNKEKIAGNPEMWMLDIMENPVSSNDEAKDFFHGSEEVMKRACRISPNDVTSQDTYNFQESKLKEFEDCCFDDIYEIISRLESVISP